MSTLLEKQIKVNRIVTTSIEHARAIEDPGRAKIMEILYHQAFSADQITNALKKKGYKKALTTVRHHLEILKNSGLIEIVKIVESRGAIRKYYGTSTKLLDFQTPEDFDSKYSIIIDDTSTKIEKILKGLSPKTAKLKGKKSKEYSQYLVLEIMNRAMTNILEKSVKKQRWKILEEKSIKLFSKKNLVFIATIMKDGSPQVSPVWANYEDGYVLINTAEGRIKHKNVLRDPRVAVSVVSKDNPLDMTTIRGTVEELIPDYEYKHIDKLTQQYMGRKHYPFKRDDEKRIILKIKPNKVFVMPEMKMQEE